MSELTIELTISQISNNDVLSLVTSALYDYFISSKASKDRGIYDVFYELSCGIEKLVSKGERYESSDRLEELRELSQTFKIKKYFIDLLISLGLDKVELRYPVMFIDGENKQYIRDYLEGVFKISDCWKKKEVE